MSAETVTIKLFAEQLGVSVRTVRRWTLKEPDPLPCYKPTAHTILIRQAEFDAWLERRRATGQEIDSMSAARR